MLAAGAIVSFFGFHRLDPFFSYWLPCWEAGTDIEYEKECIVLLDSYSYLICANRKSAA